jgi:pimeloyl-ACP methyl ester carboxylesterase
MAAFVEVNGTRTWYDERGEGAPLVLLHGGLTDSRDFSGNLDTLASRFRLFLPERRGHGHTPDMNGPITLALMAEDTIAFLDTVVGKPAHLVGYSAGAMVALRIALARPDLVDSLVLISGAFHRDGMILRPTAGVAPPPQLAAAYAEVSPDGAEHLPVVIAKIARAVDNEPGLTESELHAIVCRTLVMSGDDDLVTLEHTVALYRGLRNAQLAIVPEATHLLLSEKATACTRLVRDFLCSGPTSTLMPIRRATRPSVPAALPDDASRQSHEARRPKRVVQDDKGRGHGSRTGAPAANRVENGHDVEQSGDAFPKNIGAPATRALIAAGFSDVRQLANVPATELKRLHGLGPKALARLQEVLEQQGLSLG